MSTNSKPVLVELEPKQTESAKVRLTVPDSTVAQMKHTLSLISPSEWECNIWNVSVPSTGKRANIRFPEEAELGDAILLRTMALTYLLQYASPVSTQRVVREGYMFAQFLAENGIRIENIRNSVVQSYIDRLEHMSIGNAQRNSRIRAAASLYEVCTENGIATSNERVMDFSYRFPDAKPRKRAPDQCVVDELDILVLNPNNQDIPLAMRLIYYLVRLITNRISEVLGMDRDCLSYPDCGLFAVQIPTSKETALHIPVYHNYNFSLSGQIEDTFYRLIREQQQFLQENTDDNDPDSDYLFYDPKHKRVVSDSDFNQFLAGLISKHHIRNSDGSYPVVTSHMFRHTGIIERLDSKEYTPEDVMKEANHTSLEMTLSYAYRSKRDEAKHLGAILSAVWSEDLGLTDEEPTCNAQEVSHKKYMRLQSAPFTRIIPGMGLCQNASCLPQYEECIECSDFNVDPIYLEYFLECRTILQERLEKIRFKANEKAIAYEQNQLNIVNLYIERIHEIISKSSATENRNEREVPKIANG